MQKCIKVSYRIFSIIILVALVALLGVLGPHAAYAKDVAKDAAKDATKGKTLIDINTASQKDLESIKGIGPVKAKKIIEGRPYKSVDELSKAGLSKKEIDAIKPSITVSQPAAAPKPPVSAPSSQEPAKKSPTVTQQKSSSPPSTPQKTDEKKSASKLVPGQKVNLNTASKEEIEALPEIGPVKAQAIIDGRPYKTPEDVMKVKGIKQKTFDKIKDSITVK
jgi:competence protein ComEA